jgi:transcriptional regulator with XRE-family HTH domain
MRLVTTTFVELSDEECREMRGLRQRSKMTLKEVARRAGVTFQAVCSWESGDRRPHLDAFQRWQRCLAEAAE